jgi:signal transduction histidine kinase
VLHNFLSENRDELISRCRIKVGKRRAPRATERELLYGIPVFLTQLTEILRIESLSASASASASASIKTKPSVANGMGKSAGDHGEELWQKGFTVEQVVHNYGDLCQSVTELAIERHTPIQNEEFQTLNRCLDDAIADAVSRFSHEHDRVLADASEHTMNERLGVLAHEFRNLISTAMLAVSAIKSGNVGVGGSTGAILDRSLKGLQTLCDQALVDVRLKAGLLENQERLLVSEFIEDAQMSAAIDAKGRGVEFIVHEVEPGLTIEGDRQILAGALANLLQNAFKFTKEGSRVSLKSFSLADRILIEVEDECGGLRPGDSEDLFKLFSQQNADRSGLGMGLNISRRGIQANGGRLVVRNLPGKGCVFSIDLPKAAPALDSRDQNPGRRSA